jgi:hypothetical protein
MHEKLTVNERISALPSSGSLFPCIANVRAAPDLVGHSADDLRSGSADEAEHDGFVAIQLEVIDLDTGR